MDASLEPHRRLADCAPGDLGDAAQRRREQLLDVLVVDEAQNLTPHEVKTVLTRAGEGTKIILTGDPYQIDNPYVDSTSNGLTYVVERFKESKAAGHITLRDEMGTPRSVRVVQREEFEDFNMV